jgi:hypothetical protein
MNPPTAEEISYAVLFGALCVGGAVVGAIFGWRRRTTPWPAFFALTAAALGLLTASAVVGSQWAVWADYDKGLRGSVESAKEKGYEVRQSTRDDGTVVYEIKNYVVPDGSYVIFANRSAFRPEWPFILKMAAFFGAAAALVSLASRNITRRLVAQTPA